jgi:hypothetical protein
MRTTRRRRRRRNCDDDDDDDVVRLHLLFDSLAFTEFEWRSL